MPSHSSLDIHTCTAAAISGREEPPEVKHTQHPSNHWRRTLKAQKLQADGDQPQPQPQPQAPSQCASSQRRGALRPCIYYPCCEIHPFWKLGEWPNQVNACPWKTNFSSQQNFPSWQSLVMKSHHLPPHHHSSHQLHQCYLQNPKKTTENIETQ
ncbi:hypothetical protein V8G54_002559 [Vigna mungo]|uniref:Uncharacterized protein n=1 Tax=Vigna mungo TaxID=3915 RepID=A0AAQ3P916_VIGMU